MNIEIIKKAWNTQADEYNQWDALDADERVDWTIAFMQSQTQADKPFTNDLLLVLTADHLMVLAAFRYCLGRQTYIVHHCVEWLIKYWIQINDTTKKLIWVELEDKFYEDDKARENGDTFLPLGSDADRAEWERVRRLWSDK